MIVKEYKVLGRLPDPFTFENGDKVKRIAGWERRRDEIYKTAVELQYGVMPPSPEFLDIQRLYVPETGNSLQSYRIITGRRAYPVSFTMYVHTPQHFRGRSPAVIDGDMCFSVMSDLEITKLFTDNDILMVKFNRTELACDDARHQPREEGRRGPLYECYPEYSFGALGAWAWGYSRCVDALEMLGFADMDHITFTGLSRGGKTALLAGVLDQRASIVNPEATCAGGCGCYRIHMSALTEDGREARSETLHDIWNAFAFWFGPDLGKYADDEAALPFDEHELKALIAPRILFDSQGISDIWANPIGTYQTNIAAQEVWKLYGRPENILWYWRSGGHGQTVEDFRMLLNLILHETKGEPLSEKFGKLPFDPPAPIYDWKCPSDIR